MDEKMESLNSHTLVYEEFTDSMKYTKSETSRAAWADSADVHGDMSSASPRVPRLAHEVVTAMITS
jgi:hypothetical protein